jgi:hypothetical protein
VTCLERTFRKGKVFNRKGELLGVNYWFLVVTKKGVKGWTFGDYVENPELIEPIAAAENDAPTVHLIPPPPSLYRPMSNENTNGSFSKKMSKWWDKKTGNRTTQELLTLIKACDYDNPILRDTAVVVASKNSGTFNLGQVCDIYDYCLQGDWKYVSDPAGREYVALASESLLNGKVGDCDDYAVMIAAMITAIGGEVLINYAYSSDGGHAFCEVKLGTSDIDYIKTYLQARYYRTTFAGIRQDADGYYWLDLDWFDRYPGGEPFPYYAATAFSVIHENYVELSRNLYR